MPATDFGALSDARKRLWMAEIIHAGREESFWESNGMIGAGMNTPVQLITEMTESERGAECVMQLVNDMSSDGVVGDNLMEGNEDTLFNDSVIIRLDQLRNALRHKGRMAEQRTVLRFRTISRDKLGFWLADKCDELMFLTIAGMSYDLKLDGSTRATSQLPSLDFAQDVVAPSSGRKKYAGSATSTASLTASDKVTWDTVIGLQAYAKRKRIRPIRAGGRDHYVMLLGTEGMRDLKKDATYQQNVGRAGQRGPENPLFKNAIANIDGVLIYDHQKVPNTFGLAANAKWGSGNLVEGSQALFFGAQALGYSKIGGMRYEESDNRDYNNRPALAIGKMFGMVKPQFTSLTDLSAGGVPTKQDFGVISYYHAVVQ
jgi:N4-gp56 family major capsid protein